MAKSSGGALLLGGLVVVAGVALIAKSSSASPAPAPTPGGTPGLPGGQPCQLDANIPPIIAQQITAALNATGVTAATYTQLAQYAQQNNFPMAAACLSQAAARATAGGGSGGTNPSGANPSIFSALHNQAILAGIFSQTPPSPVDWSGLNTSLLNQVAAFKAQGLSSAQALQAANLMQGGATQAQALISILQGQGIPIGQVNQIVALMQQGMSLAQATAQVQGTQPQGPNLSTWQQQAASSISKSGIDPVTAQQIASQLTDAQSRYMDWMIRIGNYSYDDARPPTISGAPELATGWQIESGMTPTQKKALGWLFQDAWKPTTGTPSISASWPPTPAVVRRLAQLAGAMSDSDAQYFITKIQAGTGIRAAYEQVIGAGGKIQVQPDGSVSTN